MILVQEQSFKTLLTIGEGGFGKLVLLHHECKQEKDNIILDP